LLRVAVNEVALKGQSCEIVDLENDEPSEEAN
jgi:hypothetical protein